ncbi:MAG: sugar phosphate isomerase/epimerase family protein [Phycisphaeraceae bacterium]
MTWIVSAFSDEVDNNLDAQIEALNATGIRHIDPRSVNGHNIAELPLEEAKAAQQKLHDAGIAVNMFGSPLGKVDIAAPFEPELVKLDHLAKMAEVFGCRRVRIFSYFNKEGKPEGEWRDIALDRLGRLKKRAQELDLRLFHENEKHIFGESAANNKAIADALRDDAAFCMIYDFDNYNRAGEDCWQAYETMKLQTDAIHLKESDKDGQYVPMGEGAGYTREILKDLLEANWVGSLTLEPHLKMSQAVAATGPSGGQNQRLADLSSRECFDLAAERAKAVLDEVGAEYQ